MDAEFWTGALAGSAATLVLIGVAAGLLWRMASSNQGEDGIANFDGMPMQATRPAAPQAMNAESAEAVDA